MTSNTCFRVLVAGAAVVLAIGCQPPNKYVEPPPPKVTVARPVQRQITDYLEFTGTTRAFASLEFRARVAGYLEKIAFKDGALVRENDLLFVIDKAPFESELASARANQEKARSKQRLADLQLRRTQDLVKQRATPPESLDQAVADQLGAVADVNSADAAVKRAQLNLGYTEIRAKFAGRMSRHLVDVGNLVQAETSVLAKLEAVDPINVYFPISEQDLLRLKERRRQADPQHPSTQPPDLQLAIGDSGDFQFEGKIDYSDFGVDEATGTLMRRGVFQNPTQRLVPGLFVRVRAALGEPHPAILVDERAIGTDQRGPFVLVANGTLNEDQVVEYRPVKLGRQEGGFRVVESGVSLDDQVIVNGLLKARPGGKVKPHEAAAEPAKAADAPPKGDTAPKK